MKKCFGLLFIFACACGYGQKIQVFNMGTFHMGGTTDQVRHCFDPNNKKSMGETSGIAREIAAFRPTIICVELEPSENNALNRDYQAFLADSNHPSNYPGEISLIAYQVGKIYGVNRLYGIDEQTTAPYNYAIPDQLPYLVDTVTYRQFRKTGFLNEKKNRVDFDSLSTNARILLLNSVAFQQYLMNVNADILTYAATRDHFEGADEASKFYHRNLRIFSNLNQVPAKMTDRIFILMGGTHTAFLNDFMSRSPRYELVDIFNFLH